MDNIIIVECMWDMDGVLVASEDVHRKKHEYVLSKFGAGHLDNRYAHEHATTFDMPENGVVVSKTIPLHGTNDATNYYWAIHNAPELEQKLTLEQWLEEEMLFYEHAAHTGMLKEREGVADVMQTLDLQRDDGILVIQGIVTNGSPWQVKANRSVMTHPDLLKFEVNADTVIDGRKGKSYLSGQAVARTYLENLSIDVSNALLIRFAVEDSPTGIRQAIGEGLSPANVIQWVIPGSKPYQPIEEEWKGFRCALTALELLENIYDIEEQNAGIQIPRRPMARIARTSPIFKIDGSSGTLPPI